MKSREATESGGDGRRRFESQRKKKNNEKRLGGGKALSLQSFANAKSMTSGYNPSIVKKQREFYRNAKYLSKFKKSINRDGQAESHSPAAAMLEDLNGNENERRQSVKRKKKKVGLEALREEIEKKQAEAERAKKEREAMMQAKLEERAKAEAKRKTQKVKMFKKTRSGQPVMKYRIEHLLQGLLAEESTS